MRANAANSSPELRKPTDQGPNPRQRRTSTREGHRGGRGGRGGGRGGNGGGRSRKDSTSASQDTPVPVLKLVVDPPTSTNTPAEPSPTPKSNSRPKFARRHSATVSEDSVPVSSQASGRGSSRRKRSQQGKTSTAPSNTPSKLLSVQTLSRKASTGPPSPNLTKDLPPHLATANSTANTTELKTDIDALVERVRAVAMDRPHTPGSHIDWADDDDSLPDLNDWGYTEGATAPAQPEEPPTSISPILEDALPQSAIPEVRIGREPSLDETKPEDAKLEPVSDDMSQTHKVQKTRSKRGARSGANPRTQQTPVILDLVESLPPDSCPSPTQPTTAAAIAQTTESQGQKRQNSNQGQNSRNNQGQTNSRDGGRGRGRGRGRQQGQSGAIVASPMRNSLPAKTGPKANHNPPIQSQAPAQPKSPDDAPAVSKPPTESDSKPSESKGETVSGDERKKGAPIETPRNADTNGPDPSPAVTDPILRTLEPICDDPQPNSPQNQTNKRNSQRFPSHVRAQTYGGRVQGGLQPPHSAPTPNFPHHSSDINPSPPNPRYPRPPNLRHSPGTRPSGLGPAPRSAGYEGHNRNHSSPSGMGGATRPPHLTRPVLTGDALSRLAKSLGSNPNSPKREPPVPSTIS